MHPVTEFLVKLAIAAVIAIAIGLLDGPLFDATVPWWLCAAIGCVIVFGGMLISHHADDW